MRAFVYVWLWPAQVPPTEAQPKSAESRALLPLPGPAMPPPAHPSQTSGPLGLAQATPVFASPPADQQGERGVWVQTCQGHFQREKRGPTPQDPLLKKN